MQSDWEREGTTGRAVWSAEAVAIAAAACLLAAMMLLSELLVHWMPGLAWLARPVFAVIAVVGAVRIYATVKKKRGFAAHGVGTQLTTPSAAKQ